MAGTVSCWNWAASTAVCSCRHCCQQPLKLIQACTSNTPEQWSKSHLQQLLSQLRGQGLDPHAIGGGSSTEALMQRLHTVPGLDRCPFTQQAARRLGARPAHPPQTPSPPPELCEPVCLAARPERAQCAAAATRHPRPAQACQSLPAPHTQSCLGECGRSVQCPRH